MYTLTLDELKERLKVLWDNQASFDEYLTLVELAYDSGSHDGFYEAATKTRQRRDRGGSEGEVRGK